jgi:hypothetical protein
LRARKKKEEKNLAINGTKKQTEKSYAFLLGFKSPRTIGSQTKGR